MELAGSNRAKLSSPISIKNQAVSFSTGSPIVNQVPVALDAHDRRPFTANRASKARTPRSSSAIHRPSTHDGKLMPSTPKSTFSRQFVNLSPRQITFRLVSDSDSMLDSDKDSEDILAAHAALADKVLADAALADRVLTDTDAIKQTASASTTSQPNIDTASYMDYTNRPTTNYLEYNSRTTEQRYKLPNFIKRRGQETTVADLNMKITTSNVKGSLSYRLNAAIVNDNNLSNNGGATAYLNTPSVKSMKANKHAVAVAAIGPPSMPLIDTLSRPPPTEHHHVDTDYAKNLIRIADEDAAGSVSSASTVFQGMSIDDVLDYLLAARDSGSKNAQFLHVTSRYNLEFVAKDNFYDLVILDRPGNPKSGFVWTASHDSRVQQKVLDPSKVMQLSLYGLVTYARKFYSDSWQRSEEVELSELMSVHDFILQRSQVDFLRTGRFFNYFKEIKVFTAWRNYARHSIIHRNKVQLLKDSFLAESELITCMLDICNTMYSIEIESELFCFATKGSICLTDYISRQLEKNDMMKRKLVKTVSDLCCRLTEQFDIFIRSDKLASRQREVKDHHPLKDIIQSVEVASADVIKLRSVMLLTDDFKQKLKKIFMIAQFRVDFTVSELIRTFWFRFKQFLLGPRLVSKSKSLNEEFYWDIDRSLFEYDGKIKVEALNHYNSYESIVDHYTYPSEVCDSLKPINVRDDSRNIDSHQHVSVLTGDPSSVKSKAVKVTKEWEDQGSHLCIDIHLLSGTDYVDMADFLTLKSFNNFKIVSNPTKSDSTNMMFKLCNDFATLVEALPSLKNHSFISEPTTIPKFGTLRLYEEPPSESDGQSSSMYTNSAYFTLMTMRSTYNATGGYELAVDAMRMVSHAYVEATTLDSHVFKLFEILRSLWTLSPTLLVKRIERSFILPKLTAYIENRDSVDDMKRYHLRDKGQLQAFIQSIELLRKTRSNIHRFFNLKNRQGLVTSFRPIVEQLLKYRSIQSYLLYAKLPISFSGRCSLFYHLIRKLTESFELVNGTHEDIIQSLERLRNWDAVRDMFDGESAICEGIYRTIESFHKESNESTSSNCSFEAEVEQLFSTKGLSTGIPQLNSDRLFHVFQESLTILANAANKTRLYIVTRIVQLKEEVIRERQKLSKNIKADIEVIEAYDLSAPDKSVTEVSSFLSKIGFEIDALNMAVKKNVSGQMILLEAHDIIGAANAVLSPSEVDQLLEVQKLSNIYTIRCRAWNFIVEMGAVRRQLRASKLVRTQINAVSHQFFEIIRRYESLKKSITDSELLNSNEAFINMLTPKIQVASCLSTPSLRYRHWKRISDAVLSLFGLNIKFSGKNGEFLYVFEFTKKEPIAMGNLNKLMLLELFDRGIQNHVDAIRSITTQAVIEGNLESTLDVVENCLRVLNVHPSSLWLKDSRIREKISIDLNEVININQLNVTAKYCMKSLLMVENTAQDMNTTIFNPRISKLHNQVRRLENFIVNLGESQQRWFYLLPFVKFSARGEIDRDAIHTFNKCTEDLKRVEMVLQQRSDNLMQAFANSADSDINTENIKSNLISVTDATHTSIQSLLYSCPRLSLLSYTRLVALIEMWLLGPQISLRFISECFQDMFEGVGLLTMSLTDPSSRSFFCTGFQSNDDVEIVTFSESLQFNVPLDEFVKSFNVQLRTVLETTCELLMLHRITCLRALLTDSPLETVLDNISSIFQMRVSNLLTSIDNSVPNDSCYLINNVSFGEDIWMALGQPMGCIVLARADLSMEASIFSDSWRNSLQEIMKDCKRTIFQLQDMVIEQKVIYKMHPAKSSALLSSLILQEVSFLRVVEDLLLCKCLESAMELWAGRYQLRFQYNAADRYLQSPIDICLGSISIPYGLEYGGAKIRILHDLKLESALQKVIGSALALRGSLFVSYDKQDQAFASIGEYAVSIKDIAAALGRVCTTITNMDSPYAIYFYLSRLLYLDGVGSMDFTNITYHSLRVLVDCMNTFWTAIENKTDQFIQDSFAFPLHTKVNRNDIQNERRKANLHNLRSTISELKRSNRYTGLILVGMASESFYTSVSICDDFYRNIFNAISIPHNEPINYLGLYLTSLGFKYGMNLELTLKSTFKELKDKRYKELMKPLLSSMEMKKLANTCALTLKLYLLSRVKVPKDIAARLNVEMQCFCSTLWERMLRLSNHHDSIYVDMIALRNDLFLSFYKSLQVVASTEEVVAFDALIGPNDLSVDSRSNISILNALNATGLFCSSELISNCALLWEMISEPANSLVVIYGDAGMGKTVIRNAVVQVIRNQGLRANSFFNDSWPSRCRRSAYLILNSMRNWMKQLKLKRIALEKRRAVLENERLYELANMTRFVTFNADKTAVDNAQDQKKKSTHKKSQEDFKFHVTQSVIHHASLSANNLLGHFDLKGRWMDGILLRKIRLVDAINRNKQLHNAVSIDTLSIIVLNGPVGYYVEQIFTCPFYLTPASITSNNFCTSRNVIFPSGELHKLPDCIKIVIETNDVSNASPACFTYIPMLRVSYTSEVCVKRLLTMWMRSLMHWLGDFHPWLEFLEFLQSLLLTKSFVKDLLYDDHYASDTPPTVTISKLSSFLRYLEDLLQHIHIIAMAEATFVIPDEQSPQNSDSSSSEDEDDEASNNNDDSNALRNINMGHPHPGKGNNSGDKVEIRLEGIMNLSAKNRELLQNRGYVSIIYAAIWGFGGSCNTNEKRKFFDNALRESVFRHFDSESIELSSDCSVFDCILDLENCSIVQAVQKDSQSKTVLINPGLPPKFESYHIYADTVPDYFQSRDSIIFRTPSTRAVDTACRHLLSTGANLLLLGSKGCGKTFLINQILADVKRFIVTPQKLRAQIDSNIVEIINGDKKNDGIFAALEILRKIVSHFSSSARTDDVSDDFTTLWQAAGKALKLLWRESAKKNFEDKTVSSSVTSLRGTPTASDLRRWLEREFTTETQHVLETSRFSYGIAFIDDVHQSMAQFSNEDARLLENRSESLLKGLMEGTPFSNLTRNLSVRNPNKLGYHDSHRSGIHMSEGCEQAILHREFCSDPRFPSLYELDDFVLQRTGIICAGTGQYSEFLDSPCMTQILPHMCVIGLPANTITDLHICLIAGAVVSMTQGAVDKAIIQLLKAEIIELSRFTINMCSQIVSPIDAQLTSELERAVRSLVMIDISLVSRFCTSLRYGCNNVYNPGGLLQLYCHEWKRYFLDPLPQGAQRDRVVNLLTEQLDTLNLANWHVSNDWMKALAEDFAAHKDRVWTDSNVFRFEESDKATNSPPNETTEKEGFIASYLPVELDYLGTELCLHNGTWDATNQAYRDVRAPDELLEGGTVRVFDFTNSIGANDVRRILYPAAISLLLRIVRILSVSGKNLLLAGYYGSTRMTAIHLAAKLCGLEFIMFEVKQSPGVVEAAPSEHAKFSNDFFRFLKTAILKVAGLEIGSEGQNPSLPMYEMIPPQRLLLGISGSQQLPVEDRRLLINLLEYQDTSCLFDDEEVLAIVDTLRAAQSAHFTANNVNFSADNVMEFIEIVSTNNSSEANNTAETVTAVNHHAPKLQPIFTSYAFHWMQEHLKSAVLNNLSIVINEDVSRTVKLDCNGKAKDAIAMIKKMSNKITFKANSDKVSRGSSIEAQAGKTRGSQRYSLLSSRRGSMVTAAANSSSSTNSKSNSILFVPTQSGAIVRDESSTDGLPIAARISEAHGVFTCSLLGPMINRRFYTIWYDVQGIDAVRGICTILMKNERNSFKASSIEARDTPSPIILALRTSSIGMYDTEHTMSFGTTDSNAAAAAVVVRLNKEEEKMKLVEMQKKKSTFKSRAVLERFNFQLKQDDSVYTNALYYLGALTEVGVLKSFQSSLCFDEMREERIEASIASLIEESRSILPHLLTVPISADALFLTEPIISPGPELIAQTASLIVMYAVKNLSRSLLRRNVLLQAVLDALHDTANELSSSSLIEEQLSSSNESLSNALKAVTGKVDAIRCEIDEFPIIFERSIQCETQLMMAEDIRSFESQATDLQMEFDVSWLDVQHRISSYGSTEWHDFATYYSIKNPSKLYLELMRGVMVLVKQNIQMPTKSEKGKLRAEEETIAKFATTLLIKFTDFVNLIMNSISNVLSPAQLHSIHVINTNLGNSYEYTLDNQCATSPYRLSKVTRALSIELSKGKKSIFDTFRIFLLLLEVREINKKLMNRLVEKSNVFKPLFLTIQKSNTIVKNNKLSILKQNFDTLFNKIYQIDGVLIKNKKKLKVLEANYSRLDDVFRAVEEMKAFIQLELDQLQDILKYFVSDISIAVSILLRAGWLPEQMRQECRDQMQRSLIANGVSVSDSPFTLGHLADRLQMLYWTVLSENSLPRDLASINCMSLLQLVPYYSFIIDPDGSVASVLNSLPWEGYITHSISAQKFSISLLESWMESSSGAESIGITMIITDLQAGASDDLICFLSADFIPSEGSHNVTHNGLRLAVNPYLTTSRNDDSTQRVISLSSKLRVFLISTKGLSMDSFGVSRPIPTCCMKHVTVVHWASDTVSSFNVDAQPDANVQHRHIVADNLLAKNMGSILWNRMSSNHFHLAMPICQRAKAFILKAYQLEDSLILKIYQILCDEKVSIDDMTIDIEGSTVDHTIIPMCLFVDDQILNTLVEAIPLRHHYSVEIEVLKSNIRDLLAYFGIITEVFSMSVDFIRTCSSFLPPDVLTPYSLSSSAICNSFLKPAMELANKNNFFHKLPHSLKEVIRMTKGLIKLQSKFRSMRKHGNSALDGSYNSSSSSKDDHRRSSVSVDHHSNHASTRKGSVSVTNPNHTKGYHHGGRNKIKKRYSLQSILADSRMGLILSDRKKAKHELSVLLIPLRTFFLRELVHYVQLSIRPGLEWLAKFLFMTTTLSQSEPIPTEEIRTLMKFVMDAAEQPPSQRFVHYIPYRDADSHYRDLLSTDRSKSSEGKAANADDDTQDTTVEEDRNHEESFLNELPNTNSMKTRITAYRINAARKTMVKSNLIHDLSSVEQIADSSTGRDNHNIQVIQVPEWLSRGVGLIEGLTINIKSDKWELAGADYSNTPYQFEKLLRWNTIKQSFNVRFNVKSSFSSPLIGDPFEYEWLKVKGNKVYTTDNANATTALGGTVRRLDGVLNAKYQSNRSSLARRSTKFQPKNDGFRGTLTSLSERLKRTSTSSGSSNHIMQSNKASFTSRRLSLMNINPRISDVNQDNRKSSIHMADYVSAARSSMCGRVSGVLANATVGLGKHRRTLTLNDSSDGKSSFTGDHRLSIMSVASTSHNRKSSITELSQRRLTSSLAKRKASSSPTRSAITGSTTSSLFDRFTPEGDLIEDLDGLLSNPTCFMNMLMLETHPHLSGVFKGMSSGIVRNISDFADWKSALMALKTVDPIKLSQDDLKLLLFTIKPPNFDDFDVNTDKEMDVGLWLQGYELTLIQSLLLSETIIPGSSSSLIEVVFALQASYLQKNGHIVRHPDEDLPSADVYADIFSDDDDEDSEEDVEDDNDDDGDGDDDDFFDDGTGNATRSIKDQRMDEDRVESQDRFDVRGSILSQQPRRSSTAVIDNKSKRSSFFKRMDKYDTMGSTRSQEGVHIINSWSSLELVLKGSSSYRGPQSKSSHSSAVSCRDFEDWESVLLDVLIEDLGIEKYVFTKQLRDTATGLKSDVFLTSFLHPSQISIFSQRARDLAVHHYDHISVINGDPLLSRSPYHDDTNDFHKQQRLFLSDLIKYTKNAINNHRSRRAIMQKLDLLSPFGNSVVSSVLLHAHHSNSMSDKLKNLTVAVGTSSSTTTTSAAVATVAVNSIARTDIVRSKIATSTAVSRGQGNRNKAVESKSWQDLFPLIISSEWGQASHGFGALSALADLNFIWLPRLSAPDVIYTDVSNDSASLSAASPTSVDLYSRFTTGTPPSLSESCGILYEELEGSLLWVLNASKILNKSRINEEIRTRLNRASQVELRVTACMISIWQLVQYLRCANRELNDVPAVWSACLSPISLWQFTRLTLKLCDLIAADWDKNLSIKNRLREDKFVKAIWLVAESFSNTDNNIYSLSQTYTAAAASASGIVVKSKSSSPMKDNMSSTRKNVLLLNKVKPPSIHPVAAATTSISSGGLGIPSNSSFGFKSSSSSSSSSSSNFIMDLKASLAANRGGNIVRTKESKAKEGMMSPRAKKQQRRLARQEKERREAHLSSLSSTDLFSPYYDRASKTIINHSGVGKENPSSNAQLIEREFINQFMSFAAHYIAEVISQIQQYAEADDYSSRLRKHRSPSHQRTTASKMKDTFRSPAMKRNTNKVNIKSLSFLDSKEKTASGKAGGINADDFGTWPDIPESMNIAFGSFNAEDMVRSMVDWTFNGRLSKSKEDEKAYNRKKILKAILKLSVLVKQGRTDALESNIKY